MPSNVESTIAYLDVGDGVVLFLLLPIVSFHRGENNVVCSLAQLQPPADLLRGDAVVHQLGHGDAVAGNKLLALALESGRRS